MRADGEDNASRWYRLSVEMRVCVFPRCVCSSPWQMEEFLNRSFAVVSPCRQCLSRFQCASRVGRQPTLDAIRELSRGVAGFANAAVRLQGRTIRRGLPNDRFTIVLRALSAVTAYSLLCVRDDAPMSTPVRAVPAALPRGPRSDLDYAVPVHLHLIGPIRPTREHIPFSPTCGLYVMPSLCVSA
jgi:hypothetical protein